MLSKKSRRLFEPLSVPKTSLLDMFELGSWAAVWRKHAYFSIASVSGRLVGPTDRPLVCHQRTFPETGDLHLGIDTVTA